MEILSRIHATNLVRWAKDKPDVLVLSADLTSSCEIDLFRDTYPDRFLSMGVAEQNMLSFAGGLAREGFFPFIHTFAVFIYRRAVRPDRHVGGLSESAGADVRLFCRASPAPADASHQAIEDVALMRSLPNMTVLDCGDATEVESVLDVAHAVPGPVYVRMLRGDIPRLFDPREPMRLGRLRSVADDNPCGEVDLGSSPAASAPKRRCATQALRRRGVALRHLHVSRRTSHRGARVEGRSPQPAAERSRWRTTLSLAGWERRGGVLAKPALASGSCGSACATRSSTAPAGPTDEGIGLDAAALVRQAEGLLDTRVGISEADLAAVRIEPVHSDAKAEAL